MIFQLMYVSYAKTDFTDTMLVNLLEKSRANNESNGVSGVLIYSDGVFVQLLEGDRNKVEETYKVISNDARHNRLTILLREMSPSGAIFPDWSMGYYHMRALDLLNIEGLDMTDMRYIKGRLGELSESNAARILHSIITSNNLGERQK